METLGRLTVTVRRQASGQVGICALTFGILAIAMAAHCRAVGAQADKTPPLMSDIALLKLSIKNVDRIQAPVDFPVAFGPGGYARLGTGAQIVVVTLAGSVPKPLSLMLGARSFVATYQAPKAGTGSDPLRTTLSVATAVSGNPGDQDKWFPDIPAIERQHAFDNLKLEFLRPSAVEIKAAFDLPPGVTAFGVAYRPVEGKDVPIGRADTAGTQILPRLR